VTHYAYHPYGVHAIHGDDGDPVRFAGGTDLGGLTMIGVRVFDPLASRFLSPDPVFQLIDDFEYTLGNPIEFGDIEGRKPSVNTILTVAATVGLAAGAAGLFVVASPAGAAIAGVSFGVASFGWAWQIAVHASQVKIDDSRSAVVRGFASDATPGTCSPTQLATIPRLPSSPGLTVVWILIGWFILRKRRHG
jgi:RHS repeat-associated protein